MEYNMVCLRDMIGDYLCEYAEKDERIYVIDSDLAKSLKTLVFQEKFPRRFIEIGRAHV